MEEQAMENPQPQIEALAQKVVQKVKQLPVNYIKIDGQAFERTIWKEFVVLVKQEQLSIESFPVQAVRLVCALTTQEIDFLVVEAMWQAQPEVQPLSPEEQADLDPCFGERHNRVADLIYARVIDTARKSKVRNPYKRIPLLEELDRAVGADFIRALLPDSQPMKDWSRLEIDRRNGKVEVQLQDPKSECRRVCLELWNGRKNKQETRRVGLQRVQAELPELPLLIESAINLANNRVELNEVVGFVEHVVGGNKYLKGNKDLQDMQEILDCGDPALFFSFAKKPILTKENAPQFINTMFGILKENCPNREVPIAQLLLGVAQRLFGNQDSVYPLLYGPPGTSKTFLYEQLCDAFTEAGVTTNYILQPMTQQGGTMHNNEISMSLQGTSSRWTSGRQGMLFNNSFRSNTQLTVVALDEVDKCSMHDYLVTLLDPRQALQDNCWREYFPSVDMRSKVLFFCTCNNVELIRKGGQSPLFSRLKPIEMRGYSYEESVVLVASLVHKRMVLGDLVSEAEVWGVTESVVSRYRNQSLPSIRTLIAEVNDELFQKRFPLLDRILAGEQCEYRPVQKIGFSV